jgi:hypothetical protein
MASPVINILVAPSVTERWSQRIRRCARQVG